MSQLAGSLENKLVTLFKGEWMACLHFHIQHSDANKSWASVKSRKQKGKINLSSKCVMLITNVEKMQLVALRASEEAVTDGGWEKDTGTGGN